MLDAKARRAVTSFVRTAQFATPWGESPPAEDMMAVYERYSEAIEQLGELIRERY